jgi:hypothetical protein
MIILVAGGDSHIWGSELIDSLHGGVGGYSRKTFSALLFDNYSCVAYPGIGNKEICQRVINACDHNLNCSSKSLVIVCWTWSSRDNVIDSDIEILKLQNFLELHAIPYLFTCVDNCIITENPLIKWQNWYLFPVGTQSYETTTPRGFYQWAVENKYKVGADGHPLEGAHRAAAFLIKEKFDELVAKHN